MRRTMKRKATAIRQANDARRAFKESFARCMVPGCKERRLFWLAVHEVANGIHRQAALTEPTLQLVLCGPCHQKIHRENWDVEQELGLRALWFPDDASDSRAAYLRVTGYAETFISARKIERWRKIFAKQARGF